MSDQDLRNSVYGAGYLSALYSGLNSNVHSTLKIEAHDNLKRDDSSLREVFQVPFNPSSLTIEYRNEWQKPQGLGSSGAKLTFSANLPERIKFKLVFADSDVLRYGYNLAPNYNARSKNSGIRNVAEKPQTFFRQGFVKNSGSDKGTSILSDDLKMEFEDLGVDNDVHKFLALTTQQVADGGTPPYLVLRWGHILSRPKVSAKNAKLKHQYHYPCQLESVDVNYTLFSRHGFPLRAELDCVFIEDYSEYENKKEEKKDEEEMRERRANSGSSSADPLLSI